MSQNDRVFPYKKKPTNIQLQYGGHIHVLLFFFSINVLLEGKATQGLALFSTADSDWGHSKKNLRAILSFKHCSQGKRQN